MLVTVAWVFFRSETFAKAWEMLKALFYNNGNQFQLAFNRLLLFPFVLFLTIEIFTANSRFDVWIGKHESWVRWCVYAILLGCILMLSGLKNYPFIYFQF